MASSEVASEPDGVKPAATTFNDVTGSCKLPLLDGDESSPNRALETAVACGGLVKLCDLQKHDFFAFQSIVNTAWGLLLRCYTDQDQVAFLVRNNTHAHPGANSTLLRLTFQEVESLSECLTRTAGEIQRQEQKGKPNTPSHSDAHETNTAIYYRHVDCVQATIDNDKLSTQELSLVIASLGNEVRLTVKASSLHVSHGYLVSLSATLEEILAYLVDAPSTLLTQMRYANDTHVRQIEHWQEPPAPLVNECINDTIFRQVSARPHKEAMCAWDKTLTYRELWNYVEPLASFLVDMGIGPGDIVPLMFEKTVWVTIAMVAVMEAGAGFCPMEPGQPNSRLQGLVSKLGAKLVLCSRKHNQKLALIADKVVALDAGMLAKLPKPTSQRLHRAEPENIAYIMWTSGSTGEPKGIIIEHRAYCSAAQTHVQYNSFTPESRTLQYSSYAFDACIIETLTPLMIGATVCVPNDHDRLNDLGGFINRTHANWSLITPSTANFLDPSLLPSFTTLHLGGEAMSRNHMNAWAGINVTNIYGPAECTPVTIVNRDLLKYRDPSIIGKGMGAQLWLVDPKDHNRLSPPGCAAELLIEGPTLARGYFKDPKRTMDVFVENPTWAAREDGVTRRMYKTGDLVRYNTTHGGLHFIGRKDTQVKLHGQRIELGEIEYHLDADPSVDRCIVIVPKLGLCMQRLVAIVSLQCKFDVGPVNDRTDIRLLGKEQQDKARPLMEKARQRLSGSLPAFMIPSMWLVIQAIPVLISGKLDRKKVSQWVQDISQEDYSRWVQDRSKVEDDRPATERETQLRAIWSHVLNLQQSQIGLQQSFLNLGGDSISAMLVQSRCKKEGIGVTVQDILRAKSLIHLATLAHGVNHVAKYEEKVEEDFDLSPIQTLFFSRPGWEKGHFNQSFFVRLTKLTQSNVLRRAVKAVVQRHSMLRARFRRSSEDDEWKQRITSDVAGSYSFRVHQVPSKEDAIPAMSTSQAAIDAVTGPTFSVDLFNLDEGSQLLFMTCHHALIDLVSWRVVMQDIEEILSNPKATIEPEASLSYQAWLKMQVEHAHRTPLHAVLPAVELPQPSAAYWGMANDKPNIYGDVVLGGFEMDAATTTAILSTSHKAMRTDTVDLLLAALIHSFSETFTDRVPPTIYNEGHGREPWDPSIDLSRTVGWFTAMYPVHVPAAAMGDFNDTLRHVKDYRRAVPSNGRPYFASRWITSKGAKKFGSHWPLEITFNYLGVYQQLERQDSLLLPAGELGGEMTEAGGKADYGRGAPRVGLFEISAVVAYGKLRLAFTYNRNMDHRDRIESWIKVCQRTLTEKPIELARTGHRPTLSDYPLLTLNYGGLEELTTKKLPSIGISDIGKVEDIYRCSQIQQGLLISTQRDAGYYAVSGTYSVKSNNNKLIDGDRLAHAWQGLIDRHASLRTIFIDSTSRDTALYDQVVCKSIRAEIVRLCCKNVDEVAAIFHSQQPMEHSNDKALHRFTIVETADEKVFFKYEISHLIIDGTSLSLIFRELVALYEGRLHEETAPSYSNYIQFLERHPADAGIGYWKNHLDDIQPTIFPVLRDNNSDERVLHSINLDLDESGLAEIQNFCNCHGVTLANVFHTAWALTLQYYTGSSDVCYGYMMSTRDESIKDVDKIVGYLVNMLVCRVMLEPEDPLISVMQQVQADLSDSQAHRQTALSEVLHAIGFSGDTLFNTSMSFRKLPLAVAGEQHDISIEEFAPYYDPTEYSVGINVEVGQDRAKVDLDYWTDCLSDGHAANVANTFRQAMKNIVEHSELEVDNLRDLSQSDQRQILSWNSRMPLAIDKCVHDVVSEKVAEQPDAPAICGWDGSYTYSELDALSDKLAHFLNPFSVGPESYVCLAFEKSVYTIIAMLGVLKAGGAFVSLDPMHPVEALKVRIEETKTQVVLTSSCYTYLFAGMQLHVIAIDQNFLNGLHASPAEAMSMHAASFNPFCVIFTSGSTGKPKGVVLEHKAMVTSAYAHGSALGVGRHTRFLQFASYTFDNNLEEIFTTLMHGGTICVPSDDDRMNDLAGAVSRLQANFMDLTPTVATYLNPDDMPTIKGLALGGEALTKSVLEVWGDKVPIHNQYGPSECTINSTHRTNIGRSSDSSSIGRSVGSVSWIVDVNDHHRLVPIGCEGELLIEGPILSRGYLNDPEKTSNSFIRNPTWAVSQDCEAVAGTSGKKNRRMYKTGDLVRYNCDGSIDYIGRKDQQVKLHGQRIELGEIEYHVKANMPSDWHFAVELIIPGEGGDSQKSLAVFVCPQRDATATATTPETNLIPVSLVLQAKFKDLEAALARVLPKHMVPAMYIPLANLPMTTSGKLDRKRLHAISKSLNDNQAAMFRLAGSNGREPTTDLEKTLTGLWESILGLKAGSLGMDAQFFRVGGDSIAAIRLVTGARSKGITLTVANIFRNSTLDELCKNAKTGDSAALQAAKPGPKPFELLPSFVPASRVIDDVTKLCHVKPSQVQDIYPCNSIQEGLIALSTKQPGSYIYQSTYHLRSIDVDKFRDAWQAVISTENILRTRIVWTSAFGFLQVVVDEPMDWTERSNRADITEGEKIKPAYNGAPLVSYAIIREDEDKTTFVWTIHHALYDGWSFGLILQKVQDHYLGLRQSLPPREPLYPKFIQYLSSVDPTESANFWQKKLAKPTSHQYPMLPHPTYQPSSTSHMKHVMPISRGSSQKITASSLIRAAWAFTISAYSNSDDVVYAETITGRDAPVDGIMEAIGPAFATIPVRARPSRETTISEYLGKIQDDFMDCLPFQHMGLQQIKRIDSDTVKACELQNLIAINNDALDASEDFWGPENSEDIATDFFTYALTVSFDVSSSEIKIGAHYDPKCISEWQLKRLIWYFESAFSRLDDNVASKLGEIRTIHAEDDASIRQWNSKEVQHIDRPIHEVILQKTNSLPRSAPAIHGWDLKLTYRELDRMTTSLAGHLVEAGVNHHDYVPICFEKSGVAAVVMLAVLKAGAAFVALDGESPKSRLQGIVHDVEAKRIICSPRHRSLARDLGAQAITVDSRSIYNASSRAHTLPPSKGTDTAYIIFTSGSTGKPKGTMISHAAFASGASAHAPAMGMSASSRVLQFASYTFDASIMEIFSTLVTGGCVCVPDEKTRLNNVAKAINDLDANWALLTPSFAQLLSPSAVPGLKTLVMGGEAMTKSALSAWADHTRLVNAYGPSECAVVATVNEHVLSTSSPSNIGRAVGGRCFVVNQENHHELVPVGAIGELVVAGPILAQGYLKEPAKTAQAFVDSPTWLASYQSSGPKSIYKTGDLVRYVEDGSILYLGRKDNQTKLHGQRLELGDVEHHLTQGASVQHGIAVIPTEGVYAKRLVAIMSPKEIGQQAIEHNGLQVVTRKEAEVCIKQVREHLTRRLPPYMVPSNWIMVQTIPLLPSGKLDRRRISQWVEILDEQACRELYGTDTEDDNVKGTELEGRLQSIWSKVLKISPERIGLDKNFLYLGGDSISALQVASQCRGDGIGITVQDIMRSHSISDLASKAQVARKTDHEEEKHDEIFSLSPIQKLFFDWAGDEVNHFNQSMVLNLNRKHDPKEITMAITTLAQSHSMLRARFSRLPDGQWAQKLDKDSLRTHRFTFHPGNFTNAEVAAGISKSQSSLDIQNGPVFAVDLFESDESGRQVVSLVAHHLVVDVVSWGIIFGDLEDLLTLKIAKTKPSFPFQTWCRLQGEHANTDLSTGISTETRVPTADLAYWGMSEIQNLYGAERTATFEIDAFTTSKLLGPCREALGSELVDIILGSILYAFCRTFSDRTQPPAVFNEAHGREVGDTGIDLSHTVGWFTAISPVVLPADATRDCDIANIIRWVKDWRSRVVNNGRQYFDHRMLTEQGKQDFSQHWPMEIAFNYLGHEKQFKKTSSLLEINHSLTAKSDIAPLMPCFALFEISASIAEDKLKISFSYNKKMNRHEAIKSWVNETKTALYASSERLVGMKPQMTLSNYPLLPLSFDTMSKLQERLPKIGVSSLSELDDVYGCSPMQQGVLTSQLKDVGQYMYYCIFALQPNKRTTVMNMEKFENAWGMVVQKHASLRTVFIEGLSPDSPMDQAIVKRIVPKIVRLHSDGEDVVQQLQRQETIKFTDAQPHHKMTLGKSNDGTAYCKLEISHAVSDGTSIPIILRDLAHFYDAPTTKVESGTLNRDYLSYVQKTPRKEHLTYWRRYLEHIEPCSFPTLNDGKKIERQLRTFELKLGDPSRLQAYCAQRSVTLNSAMQLAWALLLRTYTGNDAVCFGYLSSGRDAPVKGLENAVGLFISMLVCRLDLASDYKIEKALERISNDYLQSTAHQAFSLGDMQHELQLAGRSLFNTAFTFQKRSQLTDTESGSLRIDLLEAVDPSEYPLTVNIEAYEDNTEVLLNYWSDFVCEEQVRNVADTYGQIIQSLINSHTSDRPIADIAYCSESQRKQIMDWNKHALPKVDQCVHDVIHQQARSLPLSAPAVSSLHVDFTYLKLLSVSKRLARHLSALGAGPEVYIPICFEKSPWAIVAMLGILQAGAAFVPLEPTHPESRIQFIMNNVNAKLVLTSQKYSEKFVDFEDVVTFVVDENLLKSKKTLIEQEPLVPTTGNAAYLIFTSGTTGLPKGTIISHHAFSTGAVEHGRAIQMRKGSRILQFSNLCFDASVMEILTGLINGGCICIPTDEERMNDIPGAINRMSVDWTLLTPSVANILTPESVPTLKVLVTGGEAMQAKHIERWAGKTTLINAYGPSECAVIATTSIKVDEAGMLVNSDSSTIGHAVGCRSWAVDPQDHNKLMPVGVIGELVVEGNTVARGYLNNEEKTAKAFVSRPQWMIYDDQEIAVGHTKLIYKTGDLVRYNTDGSICYVSRKDTQIKLNGLRIELGEIEHHVKRNLPEDFQACVEMVAPAGQQSTLAAFFHSPETAMLATKPGCPELDSALLGMTPTDTSLCKSIRKDLATSLPAYMIPSLYVPLTHLPWTASGKLDSQRLRKLIFSMSKEDAASYKLANSSSKRMPATNEEKKLGKMWESLLGLKAGTVTRDDSFFIIGGDSVLAMRLVALIRREQMSLSVLDIFQKPILSEMASVCASLQVGETKDIVPFSLLNRSEERAQLLDEAVARCRVEKDRIIDVYPCSALQEGLIALSIKQAGAYVAHNVFKLPKSVDIARFKAAWEQAVQEMDILRTRIVHADMSKFVQVLLRKETTRWDTATSTSQVTESSLQLPESNGSTLMRFTLVNDNRYFVWSIHHALYDGWSLPKMIDRVDEIYQDKQKSSPIVPYIRFINYLSVADSQASNQFWKSKFDSMQALHFPKITATTNGDAEAGTVSHTFQFSNKARPSGITLPIIIKAAWAILLSAHTGNDDVLFGETLTGRDIPVEGIMDMLGPTLTTVPNRIQVDSTMNVADYLRNIQTNAAQIIPHQHVGLQNIRKLSPNAQAACDFQNLLVIQIADEVIDSGDGRLLDPQDTGLASNFFTYPLVVECRVGDLQTRFDAHYHGSIISKWHVQCLVKQFESVLQQLHTASSHDRMSLKDIHVISEDDIGTIQRWNDYEPNLVSECIHDLFLKQAEFAPQSTAVCAWDGDFTYKELRGHAQHLAKYLKTLGVTTETLVPFCLDKSRWVLVAQLGIMMADAAFVPLDPQHPSSRHSQIIQDTQATILLCSPRHQQQCSSLAKHVVCLADGTLPQLSVALQPSSSLNRATGKNAAYIIYTSGSTGRPKGVVIEHEAFCTSSQAFSKALLMTSTSRVLNFASVTFDATILENMTPLSQGSCVCVPSEEGRISDLAGEITRLRASWAFLTPSVANLLDPLSVPTLKTLTCGGEAMSEENVLKWADKVTLVNGYGPTEAAVITVTNAKVSHQKDPTNIGYVHHNSKGWITKSDDPNQLVPLGCAGELLLEGSVLAREYLHDPEKTAKAFVVNPSWAASGKPRRFYRTGDLVKYNVDGSIHYLGRFDRQVKLHGQRLELGEIEHKFELHEHIRHAVVILPKKGLCQKRLVAVFCMADLPSKSDSSAMEPCVILHDEAQVKDAKARLMEVQSYLSEQLPPYMVPALWVAWETVPLLSSGKLDKKQVERWVENIDEDDYALITSDEDRQADIGELSPTAQQLREVWATVFNLAVEQTDVTKSFMSEGGDSLVAMSIIARCRKIGITLTVQDVLQSKSLIHLANALDSRSNSVTADKATILEEKTGETFPLTPIQMLYFKSAGPASMHNGETRFNQSQLLRVKHNTPAETIRTALQTLVQQHSMLRARFWRNKAGHWQQKTVSAAEGSYVFTQHNIQTLRDINPIQGRSQVGLNIHEGPLLAVDLLDVAGQEQIISLVAHHLIIDVVSWNVLLRQLEELLTFQAETIEKPLSYQVWSVMQNEHANRTDTADVHHLLPFKIERADLAFWGMENCPNTYGQIKQDLFHLDKASTHIIMGKANRALGTQPIEILLCALSSSFRSIFHTRKAPTIFNENHGRDSWHSSLDVTETVGWFTTIYPVHIENDFDDAIDHLKRTKDLRRSIPNNGRGYFAHRWLTADGKWRFGDHEDMEILFNYTGQDRQSDSSESMFTAVDMIRNAKEEKTTADVGSETPRLALFEISAGVRKDRLQVSFIYNKNMRYQDEILSWTSKCQSVLKDLAKQLVNMQPEPTLADMPLLPTTYTGLTQHVKQTLGEVNVSSIDEVENIFVTSPMQEGLLLSQLKTPGSYHNDVVAALKLPDETARINVARLGRAWQKVIDRHQSLRTVFVSSVCKGHAFDQIALKHAKGAAKLIHCEESQLVKEMSKISLWEVNKKRKPALPHQLSICTTTNNKCFIKLELNHAVIDGGSVSIIVRDLALAYENRLPDAPKPLYSDYIKYISDRLNKDGDVAFWKRSMNGLKSCHLPPMSPLTRQPNHLEQVDLEFDRFGELQSYCRSNELTLSNIMLAAWGLTLAQVTSSNDVCFGNLTSGRDAPVEGITDTVGAFINMLVCRVSFSQTLTLKELFKKVQNEYLESLPHQHYPLAKLQHELGLGKDPLFNTAVSIQNQVSSGNAEREGDALSIELVSGHDPTEYDVTLNISTVPGDECARMKYWTKHVSTEEGKKLMKRYADVLTNVLANSGQRVSQLVPQGKSSLSKVSTTEVKDIDKGIVKVSEVELCSDASPTPNFSSEITGFQPDMYRSMVKDCVREVIEQVFASGDMMRFMQIQQQATDVVSRNLEPIAQQSQVVAVDLVPEEPVKPKEVELAKSGPPEHILQSLRSMWSRLLNMPERDIKNDDAFFLLGGDSILAMELASAAREAGLSLTVADIFGSPALTDMAYVIHEAAQSKPLALLGSRASALVEQTIIAQNSEPDARFAMLDAANAEAFIQDYICPKIGVFRGGIVDVLPVTDFQALSVTGSLVEARWMLNYVTFDGLGYLDLDRLRRSAYKVVQHFDILRTVFLPCGDRFLQVILRSMKPQFIVHETHDDLENFFQGLRDTSEGVDPRMGEPYIQFGVIKKANTLAHRFFIRLSHAQYDGVCMPRIIEALRASYEGKPLAPSPPFVTYVKEATAMSTQEHYDYWKNLLRGSAMTNIVHREQPKYGGSNTAIVRRTTKLASLASKNITPATIFKAAWAYVLAQLSGHSDVVFGNVISGRNAPIDNVDHIVGPCLNIIPIRVRLSPDWTALDLLKRIQNQSVASMPFESLGFREIIQHCTSWPEWTFFSSLVQHQNVQTEPQFRLERTKYRVGFLGAQDTLSDLSIVSTPQKEDNTYEIAMCFVDDGLIPRQFVEKAIDLMATIATNFASDPSTKIPSLSAPGTMPVQPDHTIHAPRRSVDGHATANIAAMLRGVKQAEVFQLADTLTRAWRMVLPRSKDTNAAASVNIESNFYELGGDIVNLASLTAFLGGEGYEVGLEELTARPTMGEMIAFLSLKRRKEGEGVGGDDGGMVESSSSTLGKGMGSGEDVQVGKGGKKEGKKGEEGREGKEEVKEGLRRQGTMESLFGKKSVGLARRLGIRKVKTMG